MVGDSLTNDVAGAQGAGWTGIWLNRDHATHADEIEPELTVTSLDQLVPWIATIR
jgi:FMN phosphatase YigB (HAD superfamily)